VNPAGNSVAGILNLAKRAIADREKAALLRARIAALRRPGGASYRGAASGSLVAHDPRYETGPETWHRQLHSTTNTKTQGPETAAAIRRAQLGGPWTTRR